MTGIRSYNNFSLIWLERMHVSLLFCGWNHACLELGGFLLVNYINCHLQILAFRSDQIRIFNAFCLLSLSFSKKVSFIYRAMIYVLDQQNNWVTLDSCFFSKAPFLKFFCASNMYHWNVRCLIASYIMVGYSK